ncbi:MAG: hypothetical protein KGL26_03120, partial [Pseudomonadota bacterium]|nr:hypothetical protein [Pseudomonadota bacterium]
RRAAERGDAVLYHPADQIGFVSRDRVALLEIAEASATGRRLFDHLRNGAERVLCEGARNTPLWPLPPDFKGVGDLAIGWLVGVAGDLSHYPSGGHLWRMLGIGFTGDHAQGRRLGDLGIDEGYSPIRHGECWWFFTSLLRLGQYRSGKKSGEERALGPYGEFYMRWVAEYTRRDHPAPCAAAGRRMTQKALEDLRRLWRSRSLNPIEALSPLTGSCSAAPISDNETMGA